VLAYQGCPGKRPLSGCGGGGSSSSSSSSIVVVVVVVVVCIVVELCNFIALNLIASHLLMMLSKFRYTLSLKILPPQHTDYTVVSMMKLDVFLSTLQVFIF